VHARPIAPAPPPVTPFTPVPVVPLAIAVVPPPVTPAQPIPPGGAVAPGVAQSPAAAQRREKARKHASQSAFTTRAPGSSDPAWWYYGAVGLSGLLALILAGRGLSPTREPAQARNHVKRR
jgi:hypothetical protein